MRAAPFAACDSVAVARQAAFTLREVVAAASGRVLLGYDPISRLSA